MHSPLKLVLVYGSVRPGRLCDVVAGWAEAEIRRHGSFAIDRLDPAAADFPADDAGLRRRIGEADAVLVVTPEYNHSYPAPLKALIDRVHGEWGGKPVAFVAYGGVSGGLRAVEHLRGVFAELDAHTLRETVSFAQAWSRFDKAGEPQEPERVRKSMAALLGRLSWWSTALKNARRAEAVEVAA